MTRIATWLILFWMTGHGLALAAATVSGRVVDSVSGSGLAGVSLRVEISGTAWDPPEPTADDGGFSLNLTAAFPTQALDTDALFISLSKPGYRPVTRIMHARRRGALEFRSMKYPCGARQMPVGWSQKSAPD